MNAPQRLHDIGMTGTFATGDRDAVEAFCDMARRLGTRRLRVAVDGQAAAADPGWWDALLPRLAACGEVLPCVTSSPAEDHMAAVLDLLRRHRGLLAWVELRVDACEPSSADPQDDLARVAESVARDVARLRSEGRRVVLGGAALADAHAIVALVRARAFDDVAAVGVPAAVPVGPGTCVDAPVTWRSAARRLGDRLALHGLRPELWLTDAGDACVATPGHDPGRQLRDFLDALRAPVARVYWAPRLDDARDPLDGATSPTCAGARWPLLYRLWQSGGERAIDEFASIDAAPPGVPSASPAPSPSASRAATPGVPGRPPPAGPSAVVAVPTRPAPRTPVPTVQPDTLITGGAGFIGTNLAAHLLERGARVVVYDDLSRPGTERNLRWLRTRFGERLEVCIADIRDRARLCTAIASVDSVFHFAAQVAVTTSLEASRLDFDVNLAGTLNVLDAVRRSARRPTLVFTSTNKVYGAVDDIALERSDTRYQPVDAQVRAAGIGEARALDFHSPYGCSKGAADQYVLDHARSYGIQAAVLRMSCIYGPHQLGNEDQGWVAHFLIRALRGEPITLYGDGCQVRDVLFVDDLVDALLRLRGGLPALSGRAFNMGGGPRHATSLRELLARIATLTGVAPLVDESAWRVGDQRYYVSDTSAFEAATGWRARVGVDDGVRRLHAWLAAAGHGADRTRDAHASVAA